MAQRRMFSKSVARTDHFLDMSQSVQNLYFHLGIEADDDGFVSPKMIMRMLGSTADDLQVLVAKGFVIPFQSGVIVIRHWRENNYIQADRYKPSLHAEREKLLIDKSGIYQHEDEYKLEYDDISTLKRLDTKCIQNVRVGKVRGGEVSLGKKAENKFSFSSEGKSLTTDVDYEIVSDIPQKVKNPPRNKQALALREKLYDLFEREYKARPTATASDYFRILAAQKRLKDKEIIEIVEDELDKGKKRTVTEMLSPRSVDIYLQDNS